MMERPTLHGMRSNIAAIQMGKAGLAADQKHKRMIVQSFIAETDDIALQSVLAKQNNSLARRGLAVQYAPLRTSHVRKKPGGRKDYRSPEGFNECGLNVGRSYASIAGARMEAKKTGFPDIMRHPTTINLCIVPITGCMKLIADIQRKQLRAGLVGFSYGVQIEGKFSFVMKAADYLATIFLEDEWPNGFDPLSRPGELFAMFHWHGDISDPHLTRRQVRTIVADAYPGNHRVCVKRVRPEQEDKDGQKTHGGRGFLEYAAMDKVEVDFEKSHQRKAATIAHAKLDSTWTKRNRSFSMGKSLAVTGTVIDPNRVEELKLIERLEWIKQNRHGEAYAEWFLHIWRSGLIKITLKSMVWLNLGLTARDRFLQALALVKNWCTEESAEDLCFFDYVGPLLE